jgi:uncharacterized protein YbjT (DUF2867 family)
VHSITTRSKGFPMYVLLGSNGQITSKLARLLLAGGHRVRVVGRSASALASLAKAGAEIAAGDPGDAAFLARAFDGATAVYTMTPPCYGEPDMRAAQDRIGTAIAQALAQVRVARVVNLSSVGAELPRGTGPIEGLHAQELRLDSVPGLDLLHLRPGSFMENFLPSAHVVAAAAVLPGMEVPQALVPLAATQDIAAVAARELTAPQHRGVLLLHAATHLTMTQAAAVLGAAIGKPDLAYVQAAPEEVKAALRTHGFSVDAANRLEALARWLSTSPIASAQVAPVEILPTTLETFAREQFAPAYAQATLVAA